MALLRIQISYCPPNYARDVGGTINSKFWKAKIWNLSSHVPVKKNVAAFYVSMDNCRDTACVKIFNPWTNTRITQLLQRNQK